MTLNDTEYPESFFLHFSSVFFLANSCMISCSNNVVCFRHVVDFRRFPPRHWGFAYSVIIIYCYSSYFVNGCLKSYVYWNVHHLDSWVKRDQLDVTCFIISSFNVQHVSDVNTSILRSLRLICWVVSWVVLLWFYVCWCYVVVCLGWCGIRMQAEACIRIPPGYSTQLDMALRQKTRDSGFDSRWAI